MTTDRDKLPSRGWLPRRRPKEDEIVTSLSPAEWECGICGHTEQAEDDLHSISNAFTHHLLSHGKDKP